MVSKFLTPVGRLWVPDSVPDVHFLHNADWPLNEN